MQMPGKYGNVWNFPGDRTPQPQWKRPLRLALNHTCCMKTKSDKPGPSSHWYNWSPEALISRPLTTLVTCVVRAGGGKCGVRRHTIRTGSVAPTFPPSGFSWHRLSVPSGTLAEGTTFKNARHLLHLRPTRLELDRRWPAGLSQLCRRALRPLRKKE
eukprot:358762-Chlamydomonas_euryale.AAC.2